MKWPWSRKVKPRFRVTPWDQAPIATPFDIAALQSALKRATAEAEALNLPYLLIVPLQIASDPEGGDCNALILMNAGNFDEMCAIRDCGESALHVALSGLAQYEGET